MVACLDGPCSTAYYGIYPGACLSVLFISGLRDVSRRLRDAWYVSGALPFLAGVVQVVRVHVSAHDSVPMLEHGLGVVLLEAPQVVVQQVVPCVVGKDAREGGPPFRDVRRFFGRRDDGTGP